MQTGQDAYCGLYCGACEILLAFRRKEESGISSTWKDLPEAYHGFPDEAGIMCRGCRSEEVFEGCRGCKLRACAQEKGVDYCFECEQYPCQLTDAMKALVDNAPDRFPHVKGIVYNLERIKAMGREAWLEEQKRLHSCPVCGKDSGWYQKQCPGCKEAAKQG